AFVDIISGKLIVNEVVEGQATLIPRASLHYQQNLDCKPALVLSLFNSGAPGGVPTFQNSFSNIPYNVIKESLGGGKMVNEQLIEHIKAKVPNLTAVENAECRKRCGLDKPMGHKRYPTSPPSSPLINGSSSNWTFDFVRGNVGVFNVPYGGFVAAN
ncbi:unnamed protein product, partial [Didymodactylos carnosus]